MIGLHKDFMSTKITVKINNMKRRSYRDSPPTSRKHRHGRVNRYHGSSDERESPVSVRRRARSPSSPRVSRYSEVDEFGRSRDLDRSRPNYKVLCVSSLYPKASDKQVKEILYREYRKFGEFSVRISHESHERLAYVCFRSSEDARDAIHSKPRINLFDKIALVAPVDSSSRNRYKSRARRSRSRSFSPEYDRYKYRSPVSPELYRSNPSKRFYERIPYGTLSPMLPLHDFQEIGLPPRHPHEPMIPRGSLLHHMAPTHSHVRPVHRYYGPPNDFMPIFRPHSHLPLNGNKKGKFPNYMLHLPPEEDPLATRTLFAGNLEISISDNELFRIFGRYGVVENIDVKRPLPGTGNAYAFVRYQNLDMAHRAKVELSGQYLGKLECKIGYGKAIPSQRIWVGGLNPWTSVNLLEREFDRFGAIKKIEYVKDDTCAYIQYESIDAAIAAVKEMRGVALDSPEHKLRTDFADVEICDSSPLIYFPKFKSSHDDLAATAGDLHGLTNQDNYPYSRPDGEYSLNSSRSDHKSHSVNGEEDEKLNNYDNECLSKQHSLSDIGSPQTLEQSPLHQSIDSDVSINVEPEEGKISAGLFDSVCTLSDLASKCTDIWQGNLILKSSQFPAKFHLTSGNPNVIESMMKYEDGNSSLCITQRLCLNKPKLEDVSKRILLSDTHAIFLAMPDLTTSITNDEMLDQIRPLHNLVSYLKHKEAAGVIFLVDKDSKPTTIIYTFPPCEYSANLLKLCAKNLSSETLKDDHLVVLLIKEGVI